METWLRPNRRAVWLGMVPIALLGFVGLAFALGWFGVPRQPYFQIPGYLAAASSALLIVGLVFQLRTARIGYTERKVRFFLRSGNPVEIPLDFVEAFLMGQGPSFVPGQAVANTKASTVIVRVAESAKDWQRVAVNPRLGDWLDGYITIRGAWCEPIDLNLIKRLNRQLAETKRRAKG